MRIEWTPAAVASARRYMYDQHGMRAIGASVAALAAAPYPPPPEGFHRGRYHRLRAGFYRIMYVVDDDVITVERVDRLISSELSGTNAADSVSPHAQDVALASPGGLSAVTSRCSVAPEAATRSRKNPGRSRCRNS